MRINLLPQFNCLKNKAGFTIIEAFTAIFILSFCVVALFVSLNAGFNIVNDIRENIIASSIIQEEMEVLRKTSFAGLPSSGVSPLYNSSLPLLSNSAGITKVDQYIDENIVRITLTVTWSTRLNPSRRHVKRIVTLIAKNGINSI